MAKNDYSRRSKKDVFWGDDNNNKNSSKSDELDELFRQSEALEHQKQPTPPPHAYHRLCAHSRSTFRIQLV